jgi:hypothetical protein
VRFVRRFNVLLATVQRLRTVDRQYSGAPVQDVGVAAQRLVLYAQAKKTAATSNIAGMVGEQFLPGRFAQ